MKKITIALLFIAAAFSAFAQKEGNIWYFGNGTGVNFNSGSPVSMSGSIFTNEGSASIADKTTGNTLFYTDGSMVYTKNHTVMSNGSGLLGNTSSTQSAVIIPKPGSSTLFYVFTVDAQAGMFTNNQGKFCYSVVDMTLGAGLGAVTTKNIVLKTSMTEKIAAYRHCNGRDIWVVAHEWNSNAFYAYLVTPAGVSAPVVSNTGAIHQNITNIYNNGTIGYMKISPDGTMLALAANYDMALVELFPFDNSTGLIGAPLMTDDISWWFVNPTYGGPYGLTFSPDSKLLYVSVEGEWVVFQYDLTAGNATAMISSLLQVGSRTTGNYGALQIGPNGKIYISEPGTAALGVINNPNTRGLGCNLVESAAGLTANSTFGLPGLVENFLIPPYTAPLTYTTCTGSNTLTLSDTTLNGTVTCLWNFGDPASGTADTSTLRNPTHSFSSSGTFTIKLYLTNKCKTDTLTATVTVAGAADAMATPADTGFCEGGFIQLQAAGGSTYKWSPATGLSDPNIANPVAYPSVNTTYTVTVSPVPCGDSTATVALTVYPSPPTPTIIQDHDTLTCSNDPSYISFQWYFNSQPIPGATGITYIATQDGNYNVAVTNQYGCLISVGTNIVLAVQEDFANGHIYLSPNPAGNELIIHAAIFHANEAVTISIVNVLGEVLKTENRHMDHSASLDIKNLAYGIYFVQVSTEGKRWVGRFVKE